MSEADAVPAPVTLAVGAEALAVAGRLLHDFNTEYDDPSPGAPRPGGAARAAGRRRGHRGAARRETPSPGRGRAAVPAVAVDLADECYLAELYVVPGRRGSGLGRALLRACVDRAVVRAAATSSTCPRARTTSRPGTSTRRRASAAPRARAARWPSTTSATSERSPAHPAGVMPGGAAGRDDRRCGSSSAPPLRSPAPWRWKGGGARMSVPDLDTAGAAPRWRAGGVRPRDRPVPQLPAGLARQGRRRRPRALRAPRAAGHGLRRARRAATGDRPLHLDPLPARLRPVRPLAHPRARPGLLAGADDRRDHRARWPSPAATRPRRSPWRRCSPCSSASS